MGKFSHTAFEGETKKDESFHRRHGARRGARGTNGRKNGETGKGAALLAAENEPKKLGVEEEDCGGDDPGDNNRNAGIRKFPHFVAVAGELN
jgi:hypothetical protein